MKKIVSLVLACMLLVSCFAMNAFAAVTTFDITASKPDADGYFTVTFTSPVAVKAAKLFLFLADGVEVVNPDKSAVEPASSYAFEVDTIDGIVMVNEGKGMKLVEHANGNYIVVDTGADTASFTTSGDIFTIYMKKTADITENPFSLVGTDTLASSYGGVNCTGTSATITYRVSKGTAEANIDWEALKTEEPVEDKFINDETSAVAGTTLTFAGRVGAEWMDLDYGVEFTSNKVGTRAQRYYGAKDGDTVALDAEAGTTQTFTFGAWDGTFEIILTNVSAGDKEFKFFVGDNYTDVAVVTVQ